MRGLFHRQLLQTSVMFEVVDDEIVALIKLYCDLLTEYVKGYLEK